MPADTMAQGTQTNRSVVTTISLVVRLITLMRWRASLVLLLLTGIGILEGVGLVLLVPLLGAIGLDVQSGSVGRFASMTTAAFAQVGLTPTLPLVLGVFLLVNAALALVRRTHSIFSTVLEQDAIRTTTARLYSAIVRMDWLAFSRMRASDLVVALTTSSERAGLAVSQCLVIASSAVVTGVYVVLALRVSAAMTLVVFACGAALMLSLRRQAARASSIGAAYTEAAQEFQAAVTDDLAGMKTIRSVAGEPRSVSRLVALSERLSATHLDAARHNADGTFWVDLGSLVLLSVLVLVAVDGFGFEASALLLLLFLFARIVPRLSALQHNLHFCASFLPSVQSLGELEAQCAANSDPTPEGTQPLGLHEALSLEAVSFHYTPDTPAVLSEITLRIGAGTTVALVGPSGAGKTTSADLLMGLLTPTVGHILVDGLPLTRDRIGAWRRSVSYVAQETFLFHDSIRANLQWALPGATESEMWQALDLAAADFVPELPQGLDTVVGDRGVRLSGGERQRVALARALLRRPSLLILDEATSALDPENESRILSALRRLHGTLTIVMITHRLAAVATADVIHVLERGHLVESGSWDHLTTRTGGRFRELRESSIA